MSISENRAYIGSSTSNAFEVIDISNPASPSHLYSISDGENGARLISARGVDVYDDYAYIVAYNGSSNAMNIIQIADSVSPVLSENTPIPLSTNNQNPEYKFNTTEAGTISYGGDCSSITTEAVSGVNTIIFNTLDEGVHNNCTITVTDALNNISSPLSVSEFTVDKTIPVITLIGKNNINIHLNDIYTDLGASAIDNHDGDISSNIIDTANNVNVNKTGSYNITYNVSDSASNQAVEVSRVVNVIKRSFGSTPIKYVPTTTDIVKTQSIKTNCSPVNINRKIKITSPFMKGKDIKELQDYLNCSLNLKLKSDGIYGIKSNIAIMSFQKMHNLKQDGIVGPITRALFK